MEALLLAVREFHPPVRLWLCDGKVYKAWKNLIDELRQSAPLLTLEGGEPLKNLPKARWIWKKLYQYQLDRGQAIGLIGGGSLLDIGGFCAATWKRGVPFISIPTTLIAQVDAAVGGKTGINFRQGKNLIGVFAQPHAIWIWPGFLESLPRPELRSGWVEVFKHALIAGGSLWEAVQPASVEKPPSLALLAEAATVKLHIVREDPLEEKQLRFVLNLGHTLGHLWESLSQPTRRPLLHGEAIAIGLAQEAYLSYQRGYLPEFAFQTILTWLEKRQYLTPLPPFTWEKWEKLLAQDKKIRAGRLILPLLHSPGEVAPAAEVGLQTLKEAVSWYRQRYGGAH